MNDKDSTLIKQLESRMNNSSGISIRKTSGGKLLVVKDENRNAPNATTGTGDNLEEAIRDYVGRKEPEKK